MRSRSSARLAALAVCTFGGWFIAVSAAAPPVVIQSATLGHRGQYGGVSATTGQLVGWRFQVDSPISIDRVGGHLLGSFDNDPIFAAIISLSSIDAFPQGAPFTPEEVVATTTFTPPLPSDEIRVPLAATLQPGAYALVYGAGQFGATGSGGVVNSSDQDDIAPSTISSFIFFGVPAPNQPPEWRTNLASHMRFVLEGPAALAADFDFDGDVDGDDLAIWTTAFGSQGNVSLVTGDANDDLVVDGADFLAWQQELGSMSTAASTTKAVPEPSLICLVLSAATAAIPSLTKRPARSANRYA